MGRNLLILVAMSSLASTAVMAQSTTNSIFIDQVGDSSVITVTQKGQGNTIGTEQNRVVLQGNSQTITTTQEGNNNSIQGSIVQADNVDMNVTVTGDSNELIYDQGDAASVAGSTKTLEVTGDSNNLTFNQGTAASATNATQTITVTGDTNTLTSTINADDVVNTKTIAGDGNTITTVQNGTAGKNIEMLLTGNTNTVAINQQSTTNVDTLKINSTSNGSTITINQCNAGGPC
jgi:hypothetical protein